VLVSLSHHRLSLHLFLSNSWLEVHLKGSHCHHCVGVEFSFFVTIQSFVRLVILSKVQNFHTAS